MACNAVEKDLLELKEAALVDAYDMLERLVVCRLLQEDVDLPKGLGGASTVYAVASQELKDEDDVALLDMLKFLQDMAAEEFNLSIGSTGVNEVAHELLNGGGFQYDDLY